MRKKLFAILMSAMMMVTFMPAMAFAGSTTTPNPSVVVAQDYKTATVTYVSGNATYKLENVPTTRTFKAGDNYGYVEVTVATGDAAKVAADYSGSIIPTNAVAVMKNALVSGSALKVFKQYYDLTDSTLAYNSNVTPTNLTSADFQNIIASGNASRMFNKVAIYEPADLFAARKAKDATATRGVAFVSSTNMTGYTFALKPLADGAFDPTSKAAQTVELEVVYTTSGDAAVNYPIEAGVTKKTFNIAAGTYAATDAEFYLDEVKTTTKVGTANTDITLTTIYDGAEHKIVMKDMAGFAVSYEKWNTKNGKWEAVDAITYKNVADSGKFRATVKNTDATKTTDKATVTFTVNVTKAEARVQFVVNDAYNDLLRENDYTFHVAENYDVMDYIEVAPKVTGDATPTEPQKEINKANAAAAKADEATIMAFFAEYYDVTQTAKKFDASKITAKITEKTDAAVKKAALAKYKDLLANYTDIKFVPTRATANFILDKATDIEWTKAPLTKKYHNKKGTLKKTYTFAVEAKADSKVTYKLTNGGSMIKIDKNTGKVTVKKGLKVGTYKVYVTAKAGSAEDTYILTIKMAKK